MMAWDRLLVTGFPGAGKTTMFPDALHLDEYLAPRSAGPFRWKRSKHNVLEVLSLQKRWIAEGVAGLQFLPEILDQCPPDLIIFLHGGDFRRFRATYKWWLRLRRASALRKINLFELGRGSNGVERMSRLPEKSRGT
jgi:hypothetical protein